jgi:hypothetical protein
MSYRMPLEEPESEICMFVEVAGQRESFTFNEDDAKRFLSLLEDGELDTFWFDCENGLANIHRSRIVSIFIPKHSPIYQWADLAVPTLSYGPTNYTELVDWKSLNKAIRSLVKSAIKLA